MTNVRTGQAFAGHMPGPSSPSLIHQATCALDNDAFNGLPSVPVRIVTAPTGRTVVFECGVVAMVIESPNGNDLAPEFWFRDPVTGLDVSRYAGAPGGMDSAILSDVNGVVVFDRLTDDASQYLIVRGLEANAIEFTCANGSVGDFTGGAGGNRRHIAAMFFVFDFVRGRYLTTAESGWDENTRTFA